MIWKLSRTLVVFDTAAVSCVYVSTGKVGKGDGREIHAVSGA